MKNDYGRIGLILAVGSVMLVRAGWAGETSESPQERAREILDATGVKGGIVVHLGCGKGRLTAALRASDAYLVRGLDPDQEQIREAYQLQISNT